MSDLEDDFKATVENIALRCRRHNQYEAELVFGRHGASIVGEVPRRMQQLPSMATRI